MNFTVSPTWTRSQPVGRTAGYTLKVDDVVRYWHLDGTYSDRQVKRIFRARSTRRVRADVDLVLVDVETGERHDLNVQREAVFEVVASGETMV